jgi:hypothetical protein
MSEFFEKKRQNCTDASSSSMNFGGKDRKIGVDVIDFSDDVLPSLEKDIHVNVDYPNELSI